MRVTNRSTIHDARDVHTPPPTARTPSTVSTLRVTSIDRRLYRRRDAKTRARASPNRLENCSPRARDVSDRPRRGRGMRTVRARDPSLWNSNGHVRAPFYIPLSCVSLNTYTCLVHTGGFLLSSTPMCARARRESRWGKENGRETTTRETATMSTPAKENSREDGGTVKTPSSVRARGEANARTVGGEGRRASDAMMHA